MAVLGEVPFRRYYGSIDATPLFIILTVAYYRRTGDREFVESIWPNVQRALDWIDRYGDSDGDGFVEYSRRSKHGLVHQGWKDSQDSVFHSDGALAEAPIALCEVQSYVYAAKLAASALAELLGDDTLAQELKDQAENLRRRFEEGIGSHGAGGFDGREHFFRFTSSARIILRFSAATRRIAYALSSGLRPAGVGLRCGISFATELSRARHTCSGTKGRILETIFAAVPAPGEHSRSESGRRKR